MPQSPSPLSNEGNPSPSGDKERQSPAAVAAVRKSSTSSETGPKEASSSSNPSSSRSQSHNWQAVWSAPHNAYYFWNSINGQTTWVNPLDPQSSTSGSTTTSHQHDVPVAGDLDPELSFLDPTQYSIQSSSGVKGAFNSTTGKYMPSSSTGTNFSTSERAKRQMGHYFDVDEWESKTGINSRPSHRKHPTKKEIESFKEQKKEKKKRGMGWLHS